MDEERERALGRLEEALRDRPSLGVLAIEYTGSELDAGGATFRFRSKQGEHEVPIRRRDWHLIPADQLANLIAQKVLNEVRWRGLPR